MSKRTKQVAEKIKKQRRPHTEQRKKNIGAGVKESCRQREIHGHTYNHSPETRMKISKGVRKHHENNILKNPK